MRKIALFFILVFSINFNAYGQLSCHSLYDLSQVKRVEKWDDVKVLVTEQKLFGKHVTIRQVSRDQLLHGDSLLGESLGGDEAIFIGLNSLGHMYLVANVHRFDGQFGFEKPIYNPRSSILHKGLVLRIEDKDGKLQDQIIAYLKQHGPPRAIDCASGVCKVLSQSSNIELATNMKQKLLPKELFKKIVVDGVQDKDGTNRDVQVFILGNSNPEMILKAADRYAESMVKTATLGLLPTFLMGFLK